MSKPKRDVLIRHKDTGREVLVTKEQAVVHEPAGWKTVATGDKAIEKAAEAAAPSDTKTTKKES